jgi:hypothetical protein
VLACGAGEDQGRERIEAGVAHGQGEQEKTATRIGEGVGRLCLARAGRKGSQGRTVQSCSAHVASLKKNRKKRDWRLGARRCTRPGAWSAGKRRRKRLCSELENIAELFDRKSGTRRRKDLDRNFSKGRALLLYPAMNMSPSIAGSNRADRPIPFRLGFPNSPAV